MKVYIGTSGWQYGDWREFYPKTLEAAMFLPFYVHALNSVEINVSFYRMVRKTAFESWERVGHSAPDFKFAVKLNKHFTREKLLRLEEADAEQLRVFLHNASALDGVLGPVLVQLPPSLHKDVALLDRFLEVLHLINEEQKVPITYAIEFRHKSW